MTIPFNKSFASHEKSKFWSNKNIVTPDCIAKFSSQKMIFDCEICKHDFESTVANVSMGNWCGYCFGHKLCDNNTCSFCYNRSFASSDKAIYWSSLNKVLPRHVLKYSHKKYQFNCNICMHVFNISLDKIHSENAWCQYCFNKLCDNIECIICFNNSFASSHRAKYWSADNEIAPRDIRKCSIKKYKFNCDTCHHSFISPLNNVSRTSWCPYCCKNSIVLCDKSECKMCYERSFASFNFNDKWSSNNIVTPRQVFKKSDRKYLFICNYCNCEYSIRLLYIAYGSRCNYCKNKTEKILYDWLINKYTNIKFQPKYEWCKNSKTNRCLPFDFEYNNIIIELDGPQHFKQVSNWRSPVEQLEIDKYKMKCAYDNNKHIIRILQKNVLNNIDEWSHKLEQSINKLLKITIPTTVYIGIDPTHFESAL